jgi:hypothetical protein
MYLGMVIDFLICSLLYPTPLHCLKILIEKILLARILNKMTLPITGPAFLLFLEKRVSLCSYSIARVTLATL